MSTEAELLVSGRHSGPPKWAIASAEVTAAAIIVEFRDGSVRTVTIADALQPLPPELAAQLRIPGQFERGKFDRDLGTVSWPNGADLAPEFLRWGAHHEQDCACGH